MLQSFGDIFKVPELKKRLIVTAVVLASYRVGAFIPLPAVNAEALKNIFQHQARSLLGFMDMFSGGALSQLSIFSLGIMPYINASIIISLVQGAHMIPYLDRLAKEGESGRKKLNQITRYFTLLLAAVQATGLSIAISKMPVPGGGSIVLNPTAGWLFMTVITLITGTVFVMWLGEQITEFGIGNGISLIIFAGIIDRLPAAIKDVIRLLRLEEISIIGVLIMLAVVVVVVGLVVWLETAQRKIPVQYAKRIIGRKMYGGASTYLPLKVEQSGVIAVIFAVSLLSLPMTVAQFFPEAVWARRFSDIWTRGGIFYEVIFAVLIVFFCYFYNAVAFNPQDLAENMKKSGGFIPGIRPGEHTAQYIQTVVERITLGGALGVVAIAILPDYMRKIFNAPFFFGGTSLLIVVGVALDTIGQIESHLIMRHYEGFMKQGRIKGRWFNVR